MLEVLGKFEYGGVPQRRWVYVDGVSGRENNNGVPTPGLSRAAGRQGDSLGLTSRSSDIASI